MNRLPRLPGDRPPPSDEPPRLQEGGLSGIVHRSKKMKSASKRDSRSRIVEKVRKFVSDGPSREREVPTPFEGSIYGDEDESEN